MTPDRHDRFNTHVANDPLPTVQALLNKLRANAMITTADTAALSQFISEYVSLRDRANRATEALTHEGEAITRMRHADLE